MTISQAGAVNTLWRYLTGRRSLTGAPITHDDVAAALRPLAKAANSALGAGVSEGQVEAGTITAPEPIDELDLAAYVSEIDGAVVVEVNYPGYLRVIVGEGTVFEGDTEGVRP